jgi:hypothetical protein
MSVAVLPDGFEVSTHWYVISPAVPEELALPSSVTLVFTGIVWSGPASAVGQVLLLEHDTPVAAAKSPVPPPLPQPVNINMP